jgi:hypothetical protein
LRTNQRGVGSGGDAARHREVTTAAAHHLDDERPAVRACGVGDLVARLDDRVERGVDAQRGRRAADVVVDAAGDADHLDAVLGRKRVRAGEAAVSTDHHQAVDVVLLQLLDRGLPTRGFTKAHRARRAQQGAAHPTREVELEVRSDGAVVHRAGQLAKLSVDQPFVAVERSKHVRASGGCELHHRANRRVHSRRIAT